jgi:hypothetical protein
LNLTIAKSCKLRSLIRADGSLSIIARIAALSVVLAIGGRAQSHNKAAPLLKVFALALQQVKANSHLAVLLPGELPQPLAKAKYATVETATGDEYEISLYYELGVGDAGFAGSFAAKGRPNYEPRDLPNVREVKLSHSLVGFFRPVACGGSCAPANLWWEEGRVLYQIQLVFPSTLHKDDQRRVITTVANSAILAGPR